MAGHEKLYCHDCFSTFEVAWTSDYNDIEEDVSQFESAKYCPLCGSEDIDDPIYKPSSEDESP